ncbi:MAG: Dabb family protein [Bacteroidota bacterium]|nr:Dabb family protein [Bacteroidota bacterium]
MFYLPIQILQLLNQILINMALEKAFVHHVYFWLKNIGSKEDQKALLQGLEALSKVPTIQLFHIGVPADTNREVIDTTYACSWLAIFNSKEEEEIYQHHPIHLEFIKNCSHLWSKVIVYDSVRL